MAESLEDFTQWKVTALKEYLSARGLSSDGNKPELAALAYAAQRLSLPCIASQAQCLESNRADYERTLKLCNIQDPFSLCDNWCDEKEGLVHWPPTYLTDIIKFFNSKVDTVMVNQYLNDYKIGKAYEYFKSDWLKEVFFHNVTKEHPCCLLRAKCTPSQRLNEEDHDVWACIEKETGEVRAAFCSCTAGLGQTCNHVAGLLFRVEAANKLGQTSCTSSKCTWNVPKEKKELQHAPLATLDIVKSRHGKKKSRPLVNPVKRTFKPAPDVTATDIDQMMRKLGAVSPKSCLFKGLPDEYSKVEQSPVDVSEQSPEDVSEQNNEVTEMQIPGLNSVKIFDVSNLYISNVLKNYKCLSKDDVNLDFCNLIPCISDEEQLYVNSLTVGQYKNSEWVSLREGRITASNVYAVYTRVNSLLQEPSVNVEKLVQLLCGYTKPNDNIRYLKYGREMEPIARKDYYSNYLKSHNNVTVNDCGIFIDTMYPYLAASPDALVSCSCCGDGLLEIKCLLIEKCNTCLEFCSCKIPECLHVVNGHLKLKENHKYYGQVQTQLSVTKRKWCDFFVHTSNGTFTERVNVDMLYVDKLLTNVHHFYIHYMVPEIISEKLKTKICEQSVAKVYISGSIFFCPVCKSVIKESENVKSFGKRSICCDKCNRWYHFKCVKMTKSSLQSCEKSKWYCNDCK